MCDHNFSFVLIFDIVIKNKKNAVVFTASYLLANCPKGVQI